MLDCLIVGDSIALGLAVRIDECPHVAVNGVPSATVLGYVGPAAVLVVSAGSNDPLNPGLEGNLWDIRTKASGKVIWILPMHAAAAEAVQRIAYAFGDKVVGFAAGTDNVHPAH